jgi:GNAT superfamily N-acetyltransferase
MNQDLIRVLKANMGAPLSPEIAADIMLAANQLPALVSPSVLKRILPAQFGKFAFSRESIEGSMEEMKLLHRAHWQETEAHRHGLAFNPDYDTFVRYERAGRYVLFTVREGERLMGNCAMYLDMSAHTKTLIATEDTLYLLPEARKGRTAARFVSYVEEALKKIGAKEIVITVKTVNRAARFFRMLGYKHVENGLTKVLED